MASAEIGDLRQPLHVSGSCSPRNLKRTASSSPAVLRPAGAPEMLRSVVASPRPLPSTQWAPDSLARSATHLLHFLLPERCSRCVPGIRRLSAALHFRLPPAIGSQRHADTRQQA